MLARLARAGCIAALVVPNASAANVFIVGTGPGATHADIQSAVYAASDGDVILVRAGNYPTFEVFGIDVSIVADTAALVHIDGAIRIAGTNASQTVLIAGLVAQGVFTAVPDTIDGLHVSSCAGSIRLQDCTFAAGLGTGPCGPRADGALLENCSDVSFTRCELRGASEYFDWTSSPYDGTSGMGLVAMSATVSLYDCTVMGGTGEFGGVHACGAPYGAYYGGDGGNGASLETSFVFASGTTFTGGDGGDGVPDMGFCNRGGNGGDGLLARSGPPSMLVGCTVTGGARGLRGAGGISTCSTYDGFPGLPIRAWPGSQPAIVPGPARRSTAPRVLRDVVLTTLSFHGLPGEHIELWETSATRFRFLPAAFGVRLPYEYPVAPLLPFGTVGPFGMLTRTWFVGALAPGESARRIFVQPVFIDPSGTSSRLGTPNVVVIVDHTL